MKNFLISNIQRGDLRDIVDLINQQSDIFFKRQRDRINISLLTTWFEREENNNESRFFCLRSPKSDEIFGICQIFDINQVDKQAGLYISLRKNISQRESYIFEGVFLLLITAFEEIKVDNVFINLFGKHKETIQSFINRGFIEEDSRENVHIDGKVMDVVHLSISKTKFSEKVDFWNIKQ